MARASDSPVQPVSWHVVVPVKESVRAKSRLAAPYPLSTPALARAVAADTLEQVCRALPPAQVTVVTSDETATEVAGRLGTRVMPDPGTGLDGAIRAGLESLGDAPWQAVLLGDLPALTAHDLGRALVRCAAYPRAVVPDAAGTGTVLLTSTQGSPEPSFGAGSAQRHARTATLLDLDLPRLRRDVDTWADLGEALALGVGPATRAALAHLE